jgi:hypothetical protein
MNRRTPETDARTYVPSLGASTVPAEFARQLEQQRDEARDKYDNLATEHMLVVNKLCEERDEARKQIDDYRERHDLLPISWEL